MENKFQIGDKVDFINDYGVKFSNLIITGVDKEYKDEIRYFVAPLEPSFEKWNHSYKEKNLYIAGTEIKIEPDLKLNNGSMAVFLKFNDNYNKVYEIDFKGNKISTTLVDGSLYTINDYDEPINSLPLVYQPQNITNELEMTDESIDDVKKLVEDFQKEIKSVKLEQK